MKVFYWQGAYGKEVDFAFCEKVIQQLLAGDYQSASLEKLTGHNVFSARINDTHRMIFDTIYHNDIRCLHILEIAFNHDYKNAKVLKNPSLVKLRNAQGTQALKELDFQQAESIPNFEPSLTSIEWVKTKWDEERYIVLTDEQGAVSKSLMPAVVYGMPGSGKTCVAEDLLEERIVKTNTNSDEPLLPLLFVTESPEILKKMKGKFGQQVECKNWKEVLLSIHPEIGNMTEVGEDDFRKWLDTYIKQSKQRVKTNQGPKVNEQFLKKYHAIYLECTLIMAFYDKADTYSKLGKTECEFEKLEERQWLYQACSAYVSYLKKENKFNKAFYKTPLTPRYRFIVADETQDYTILPVLQMKQLAEKDQIVYCIDSHQKIKDNPHIFSLLIQQVPIDKESRIELHTTFRSCQAVVSLANTVLDIIYLLTGGKAYKEEYTKVQCDKSLGIGEALWLNNVDKDMAEKIINTAKGLDLIVIIPDDEDKERLEETRAKASKRFGTGLVYTVPESKGLGYGTVVLYNFLSQALFYKINKLLAEKLATIDPNISQKSVNRAKTELTNTDVSTPLAQLLTGITRTKTRFIGIQEDQKNLDTLMTKLESATMDFSAKTSNQWEPVRAATREECLAKAHSLINDGDIKQAQGIFLTNLGESIESFERFYKEKTQSTSPSPVSKPIETQEPKSSKATKSPAFFQNKSAPQQKQSGPAPTQKKQALSKAATNNNNSAAPLSTPISTFSGCVKDLLGNFNENNLRTIFKNTHRNKILFDTPDLHNVCAFEKIILLDKHRQIFKTFLSNNTQYIPKLSAKSIWEVFKKTISSTDLPLFIRLVTPEMDNNEFLMLLVKHHPTFANDIDIDFLLDYQEIYVNTETISNDKSLFKKLNKKHGGMIFAPYKIWCTPLFMLTYSESGRKVWSIVMNKRSELCASIPDQVLFENAGIPLSEFNLSLGSIFCNLVFGDKEHNILELWIKLRPSAKTQITAEGLFTIPYALNPTDYSIQGMNTNPAPKCMLDPFQVLMLSNNGVAFIKEIFNLNHKLINEITLEQLTTTNPGGSTTLYYLTTSEVGQWVLFNILNTNKTLNNSLQKEHWCEKFGITHTALSNLIKVESPYSKQIIELLPGEIQGIAFNLRMEALNLDKGTFHFGL